MWSTAVPTSSGICVPVSRAQRAPCGKSKPWVTGVKIGTQQERDRQGKEVPLGLLCNQVDEGKRKSIQRRGVRLSEGDKVHANLISIQSQIPRSNHLRICLLHAHRRTLGRGVPIDDVLARTVVA